MSIPLDLTRAALVVLDAQRDCLHDEGVLARRGLRGADQEAAARIVENCRQAVEAMRAQEWPIVFVQTAFRFD